MPGQTEVLTDDLREVKSDLHRIDVGLAELRPQEVKDAIGLWQKSGLRHAYWWLSCSPAGSGAT